MQRAEDTSLERAVLFTVGFGGMLVPLNSTMIAVALPAITRDLDASVAASGWLVTAYLIVMAALQPITGKLGDRYGRRPFLLGGYALFLVSSVGAAMSPHVLVLIAFRGGQALAGAVIFPNGSALLRTIVPEHRRGARFGLLGSSIAFGAAIGPPLGGVLVEAGGWPAIFWVNLPIVAVVLAIAWRTIPRSRYLEVSERFDVVGATSLAVLLAAGAWLLTRLRDLDPSVSLVTGVVVVAGFVMFVWHEFSHPDPVVQPRFFGRRTFAAANGGIAASNLTMYSLLLIVPLLLARRPGWSEARIGLVVTSMSIGMVVFAPIGGRLSDRLGRRTPAVIGMTLVTGGTAMLTAFGSEVSAPKLIAALSLAGIGLGMGSGSLQTAAVESIEPEHAGMAAGASSTSRYVGSVVGAALLAGLVASPSGSQTVFAMTAIGGASSLALAFFLPGRRRPRVVTESPDEVLVRPATQGDVSDVRPVETS